MSGGAPIDFGTHNTVYSIEGRDVDLILVVANKFKDNSREIIPSSFNPPIPEILCLTRLRELLQYELLDYKEDKKALRLCEVGKLIIELTDFDKLELIYINNCAKEGLCEAAIFIMYVSKYVSIIMHVDDSSH